jgi:predicted amino acid dehydrogenase
MECAIVSRAGQVLARGKLVLDKEDNDLVRLNLKTYGGKLIEGGIVDDSGDLTKASAELFQRCYETWRMAGLTLTVNIHSH